MFQFWLRRIPWDWVLALGMVGKRVGCALGWWGDMARLCDSPLCLAMVIAKTQQCHLHTRSLPCPLPWSPGLAVWNMLIIQAGLFRASKSQKKPTAWFSLSTHPSGSSVQHSTAPVFVSFSLFTSLSHAISPPSDALICKSLRGAGHVQVECYFFCIVHVQLVVISRGEISGDPSHCHASDVTLFYLLIFFHLYLW